MRSYARSLIAQHDKDGDKMLKGKELEGLRGPAAQADLDKDGVITSDELVMKLSGGASAAPASAPSAPSTTGGSTGGNDPPPASDPPAAAEKSDRPSRSDRGPRSASSAATGSRTLTNGERKSYRFKTPKERAPSGLPSFFSRDADGDGQISMHEYATSWNDRLAAEFVRLDLNGDGVITPKEAASGK